MNERNDSQRMCFQHIHAIAMGISCQDNKEQIYYKVFLR